MVIVSEAEISALVYLAALEANAVTPKMRTQMISTIKYSVENAKAVFDVLLSGYLRNGTREAFIQDFALHGLDRICSIEAASVIFEVAANPIRSMDKDHAVQMLSKLLYITDQCHIPELAKGIRVLVLNAMVRQRMVGANIDMAKSLMRIVQSDESQNWIPTALYRAIK